MLDIQYCICPKIQFVTNVKKPSLLCLEEIPLYNACASGEKAMFANFIQEAQALVERYLGYELLIGKRCQRIRKCYGDCNGNYIYAYNLPIVYSETMFQDSRLYVKSCCDCNVEYISGFVPCGWGLTEVNAYLGTTLTVLPSYLDVGIKSVIWNIASYKYNESVLGLDGLVKRTITDADLKITSWQKDVNYIESQLRTLSYFKNV